MKVGDYEIFSDNALNDDEELVHLALVTEAEPVEFNKVMNNEAGRKTKRRDTSHREKSNPGVGGFTYWKMNYCSQVGV